MPLADNPPPQGYDSHGTQYRALDRRVEAQELDRYVSWFWGRQEDRERDLPPQQRTRMESQFQEYDRLMEQNPRIREQFERLHAFKDRIESEHGIADSEQYNLDTEIASGRLPEVVKEKTFFHLMEYIVADILSQVSDFTVVFLSSPFDDVKNGVDLIVQYKGKYVAIDLKSSEHARRGHERVMPANFIIEGSEPGQVMRVEMSRFLLPLEKMGWIEVAKAYLDLIMSGEEPNIEKAVASILDENNQSKDRLIESYGDDLSSIATFVRSDSVFEIVRKTSEARDSYATTGPPVFFRDAEHRKKEISSVQAKRPDPPRQLSPRERILERTQISRIREMSDSEAKASLIEQEIVWARKALEDIEMIPTIEELIAIIREDIQEMSSHRQDLLLYQSHETQEMADLRTAHSAKNLERQDYEQQLQALREEFGEGRIDDIQREIKKYLKKLLLMKSKEEG